MAVLAPERTPTAPAPAQPPAPRATVPAARRRRRLSDVSLRKRIVGSSVGAALLVLAMAGVAVWGTTSSANFAAEPLEDDVRATQVVGDMRYAFSQAQFYATASAVAPTPEITSAALEKRDVHLAELDALAADYRAELAPNDEAASLVADVQTAAEAYLDVATRADELLTAGRGAEVPPLVEQMDEEATVISDSLARVAEIHETESSAGLEEMRSTATAAVITAVLWSVVGTVVMVIGGAVIGRGIARTAARVVATSRAMAAGDLTTRSDNTDGDELGQIAPALDEA